MTEQKVKNSIRTHLILTYRRRRRDFFHEALPDS